MRRLGVRLWYARAVGWLSARCTGGSSSHGLFARLFSEFASTAAVAGSRTGPSNLSEFLPVQVPQRAPADRGGEAHVGRVDGPR